MLPPVIKAGTRLLSPCAVKASWSRLWRQHGSSFGCSRVDHIKPKPAWLGPTAPRYSFAHWMQHHTHECCTAHRWVGNVLFCSWITVVCGALDNRCIVMLLMLLVNCVQLSDARCCMFVVHVLSPRVCARTPLRECCVRAVRMQVVLRHRRNGRGVPRATAWFTHVSLSELALQPLATASLHATPRKMHA